MSPDIVFEERRKEYLLDLFDKEQDEEGYIVDPETDERVTRHDSDEPITLEHLGVVGRGSEIFVEDEVDSIVQFVREDSNSDA